MFSVSLGVTVSGAASDVGKSTKSSSSSFDGGAEVAAASVECVFSSSGIGSSNGSQIVSAVALHSIFTRVLVGQTVQGEHFRSDVGVGGTSS